MTHTVFMTSLARLENQRSCERSGLALRRLRTTRGANGEKPEVVDKAKREIERIVSKKLVQRFDRVRGGKA
jgi:hypothetical protein